MALCKYFSDGNLIFIEEIPRVAVDRNGLYQSNFMVRADRISSRIVVLANQPIYAADNNRRFELAPSEVRELLGYPLIKIKKVSFLDITQHKSELAKSIQVLLEELEG